MSKLGFIRKCTDGLRRRFRSVTKGTQAKSLSQERKERI